MEIRVLRYFLEIAREGSITKASKKLHISQPTLSRQIKTLEEELGRPLFVRSTHSVRLTDAGAMLKERAQDIFRTIDAIEQDFHCTDEVIRGEIHIGCAESVQIRHLAQKIKNIQLAHPAVQVHLYSGDTSDLADRLDRGLFDFAVLAQNADLSRYTAKKLPECDRWGLVMPEDHPLAAHSRVTRDDLRSVPLIVSRQCLQQDLPRFLYDDIDQLHIAATLNLAYNGSLLVKEGVGCELTFDGLVATGGETGLCFRPLEPKLETDLYVVWRKHQQFSPPARLLYQELMSSSTVRDDL